MVMVWNAVSGSLAVFFGFRGRFSASATCFYPPKEDHFCRIQGHVPGAIFSMTTTARPVAQRSRGHCQQWSVPNVVRNCFMLQILVKYRSEGSSEENSLI